MEKEPVTHIGGSLTSALKGDYNLNVALILKEAWELTKLSRKAINVSLVLISLVGAVLTSIVMNAYGGYESALQNQQSALLINLITSVVLSPLFAGVEMFGVMASVGIKSQPKMLLTFIKYSSSIALCALCTMVLTTLGIQLLLLPGIYIIVALTLTMPLIIEKKLTPLNAIIVSFKATRFQWFNLFFLHLIMVLLLIMSLVPFMMLVTSAPNMAIIGFVLLLFALSYIAPMYFHMKGIVYREIFGLGVQTVDAQSIINNGNDFLA